MAITYKYVHNERLNSLEKALKPAVHKQLVAAYDQFVPAFLDFTTKSDVVGQCEVLTAYLDTAKRYESLHANIGYKSKYYSSILEEVPVLMLKQLTDLYYTRFSLDKSNKPLLLGHTNCVIRVAAGLTGEFHYDTKRLDFCFAVKSSENVWIPLIGLEAKKYVDKTMMATVLDTYKALKVFRARTFYGVLVEDEGRSKDSINNSEMFLNEFILTKSKRGGSARNPIDSSEFQRFQDRLRIELWYAFEQLASK